MVTGTSKSHQRVRPQSVLDIETVRAPRHVEHEFASLVGPLFDLQLANRSAMRTLAATRDLLLPKLMSGELRIRDAERVAGEFV